MEPRKATVNCYFEPRLQMNLTATHFPLYVIVTKDRKTNPPSPAAASIFSNVQKKDYFREELYYFYTDFQVQKVNSSLSLFFTLSEVKELKRLLMKKMQSLSHIWLWSDVRQT